MGCEGRKGRGVGVSLYKKFMEHLKDCADTLFSLLVCMTVCFIAVFCFCTMAIATCWLLDNMFDISGWVRGVLQ